MERMKQQLQAFEKAGLTQQDLKELRELSRTLMEDQSQLRLQLQSLAVLIQDENAKDEDIQAAFQAFVELRDQVLQERQKAVQDLQKRWADKMTPRIRVILLGMGILDNGIRLPSFGMQRGGQWLRGLDRRRLQGPPGERPERKRRERIGAQPDAPQ